MTRVSLSLDRRLSHDPLMALLRKILVGVDFSEPSRRALRRAGALARLWGVPLAVVHVLKEHPYEASLNPVALLEMLGETEEGLSKRLEDFTRETLGEGMPVETELRMGVPDRDLLAYAKQRDAGLIVLGGHGKSALQRFLLGSLTESVAGHASVPVWVERGDAPETFRKVVLPTDLSPRSRHGVVVGLEWARRLGVSVVLLHVAETRFLPPRSLLEAASLEEKVLEMARGPFEDFVAGLPLQGLEVDRELRTGHATEEVEAFLRGHPDSLLVFSSVGRSAPLTRRMGSVALQLLRHAPVATLLVPPDNLESPF